MINATIADINANVDKIKKNILETKRRADIFLTKEERWEGINWYRIVNANVVKLANESGHAAGQVAGALAALSPNTSWGRNWYMLEELIKTGETTGLGTSIKKAKLCLQSNERQLEQIWEKPMKTARFAYNCGNPDGTDYITLDRHALALAGIDAKSLNGTGYELLESIYLNVARSVGMRGHELQALTWTHWRGGAW